MKHALVFFLLPLNYFWKQIKILFWTGSITFNALSGKIMFRDIVYINYDYAVRIQDGYLIFRWWRSYVPKDVSEGIYCFYEFNLFVYLSHYFEIGENNFYYGCNKIAMCFFKFKTLCIVLKMKLKLFCLCFRFITFWHSSLHHVEWFRTAFLQQMQLI